jgi:hypothetical protein
LVRYISFETTDVFFTNVTLIQAPEFLFFGEPF